MLVQVYGGNAMKKIAVYKWVKSFSEGRESVTNEERSDHVRSPIRLHDLHRNYYTFTSIEI